MKVSLKWLNDYIDISLPAKELGHRLTMSGTEVGGIEVRGGTWDNIVVAQLVGIDPHPNADRLRLATADTGTEKITVVCGAPNLTLGDKVAFASVGAQLIDPRTDELSELKPARIRGVASEGMVCSEKELGISDNHEGIMVLPPEAPVGTPLAQYLGDTILDLDITPNRPDCLSVIGIAGEVAALTGNNVRLPEVTYEEAGSPIEELASVEIADPGLCRRYCASLISDVVIAPSPPWMQERLLAAGMRPINNIVDITNYVMLEFGQPLHAFDYKEIRDKKIIVRRARAGETLTTIDGVDRALTPDMLVIADGEGAVALAGVMGGAESEVIESTTSILLESANFHPSNIRRTSTNLHMRSEASSRFEKGLNPELASIALRRATQLMIELAGGSAARGIIDVYPGKTANAPILLTRKRVKQVLGMELNTDEMTKVLNSLGFVCAEAGEGDLSVTIPYWRTDVRIADDLVEELARLIGYESIPTTMLSGQIPASQPDSTRSLRERIRDILVSCGLQEVLTYPLTSLDMIENVTPAGQPVIPFPLRVLNPLTREQEYLRTTLRSGLLAILAANEKHEASSIRLFEIGKIYIPRENDLPEEREIMTGVLGGPRWDHSWQQDEGELDFYDVKGIVETLFERLGVEASFTATEDATLRPGRTASICVGDLTIGILGELHTDVAERFEISAPSVYLFEIDLAKLYPLVAVTRKYQPLVRYPSTLRDIAVVVDTQLASQHVVDIIQASPLVSEVTLFDVYIGKQIPPGKKSLAYHIAYRSPSRTLTDEEVDKAQSQIVDRLQSELEATLRG